MWRMHSPCPEATACTPPGELGWCCCSHGQTGCRPTPHLRCHTCPHSRTRWTQFQRACARWLLPQHVPTAQPGLLLPLLPLLLLLQPAVGSHRVWATEIVSMLLAPNHQAVDNLVASSKLVPTVLQISLAHPQCSALHTRALRILRSCCVSKVGQLYGPLFTPGLGAGLTLEGGALSGSLLQQLAQMGEGCLAWPGLAWAGLGGG